jgi:hypothetical protein
MYISVALSKIVNKFSQIVNMFPDHIMQDLLSCECGILNHCWCPSPPATALQYILRGTAPVRKTLMRSFICRLGLEAFMHTETHVRSLCTVAN